MGTQADNRSVPPCAGRCILHLDLGGTQSTTHIKTFNRSVWVKISAHTERDYACCRWENPLALAFPLPGCSRMPPGQCCKEVIPFSAISVTCHQEIKLSSEQLLLGSHYLATPAHGENPGVS